MAAAKNCDAIVTSRNRAFDNDMPKAQSLPVTQSGHTVCHVTKSKQVGGVRGRLEEQAVAASLGGRVACSVSDERTTLPAVARTRAATAAAVPEVRRGQTVPRAGGAAVDGDEADARVIRRREQVN